MSDRIQIEREISAGILKMQRDLGIAPVSTLPTVGRWLMGISLCAALLVALTQSAQSQRSRMPKIEGCAAVKDIVAAEAFNRGHQFKDAHVFQSKDALFLSRWVGMSFPGTEPVIVVSYSDGSAAVLSFVGAPECWRMQIMERRK